jgi:multidrug efflux pump subunit AcrA (membrane-fusion protein)
MAVKQPIRLQARPKGVARVIQRRNIPVLALGAIALALAILIFHDVLFPSSGSTLNAPRTALVSSGTVTDSVSSSGSLVPTQQLNLGFKTPGTLTAVNVKVGDVVSAGQVLARLDTTPLQLALQQAQAQLAAAQAQLSSTETGTALQQASDQLAQARQAYNNAAATLSSDQSTLNADTLTLNTGRSNSFYLQYPTALADYQSQLNTAQVRWVTDSCTYSSTGAPCSTDLAKIQADQNKIACIQGSSLVGCTAVQQEIALAYRAVAGAQAQVNGDSAKVSADSLQLQQAQNSVTNAQDGYNSQALNRPSTIAQQSAQVAAAQAQVTTAQANLDSATLTAPMAGVITGVSDVAGDAVSAGGSSSGAQAPGTTALLPSGGSSGSSSGAAGGGGGFITMIGQSAYITVVSFAESDAAKVQAGQAASVTFDAISALTIPAHVLAVSPSATVTSNVVNYYVTLALDDTDPSLRSGLTTNATVVTAQASNVLTVLNTAVIHRGTQAFVNLLVSGREVLTAITVGIVGTTTSEVMTGLKAGDKVVLPTVSTTSTSTGFGGGGGGRFGGGGGQVVGVGGG